jgi:ribosomal protein L40E
MPVAEISVHPDQTARISSPWGFPLREDVTFTDVHGVERRGATKVLKRAIEKLQEPLRKILEPGEVLLYLARGQIMPGKLQRYTQGTQSHFLAPAALILTNWRLLHLSVKWNGTWNRNVRSAYWGDVKEGHVTGFRYGKLHLEYRQGWKETYWRIPRNAAKKIQFLLDVLLPASAGETSPALAMVSLCPQCLAPLTPGVYQCRRCGLRFKDGKTLLLHALMIPGGAYFYVGLNLFGVAHACVDVAIFSSLIGWVLALMGRVQPHLRVAAPPTKFTYAVLITFLASALVYDIWLAIRIARNALRNFIPDS